MNIYFANKYFFIANKYILLPINIYFAYKYIFIGHKYLNIEYIFKYGTNILPDTILQRMSRHISPLFHNIFNISLTSGVKLLIHLLNVVI